MPAGCGPGGRGLRAWHPREVGVCQAVGLCNFVGFLCGACDYIPHENGAYDLAIPILFLLGWNVVKPNSSVVPDCPQWAVRFKALG